MFQALYNIIIYPLIQIIEVVYLAVHKVFKTSSCPAGYAIIGVSVAITFLCLPLYVVAEKWQQIERDTQKKLKPGIDRIKAAFKGDEQYMILSTFYRQNHYHPMMALRSSFGLLIQIPFFMAAYQFLSNMDELVGLRFFFIKDLGTPDATFHIGNFSINILPIVMTLINCVAGAIYTVGGGIKEKVQIYGMAAVFLVILYNSPAGLVLYWTMNNIFSLVKNIFYKLKNPLKVLYILCSVFVLGADWFIFFKHSGFLYRRIMLICILSVALFIPLILKGIKFLLQTILKPLIENNKQRNILFFTSASLLCILIGFFLPSSVISASPQEFSFIEKVNSPFTYLRVSLCKSLGFFIFWSICIYFLFGKNVKTCISIIFAILAIGTVINVFAFSGNYGNLSVIMNLDNAGNLKATKSINLINLSVLTASIAIIIFLIKIKKYSWISLSYVIAIFSLCIIGIINCRTISKNYKSLAAIKMNGEEKISSLSPILHLSKTEKNVFIIDFDRFLGAFIPEILQERPELKSIFSGFVYYPNTASFGDCTIAGSPAMFGGYDYTPVQFTLRSDESLVSKHNEACIAMPRLFSEHGFDVTVSDTSFANHSWVPDMRIFDTYPKINALQLEGAYTDLWLQEYPDACGETVVSDLIKRNLILYSIMRSIPTIFRDTLYNDGKYWNTQANVADMQAYINSYSIIDYLDMLTDFESEKPTYTFMVNNATHEPTYLQYPDYIPTSNITDKGLGRFSDNPQYHSTIGSLLKFSEWIEYLKENNVYDNTKIIIVSDHGCGINTGNIPSNMASYNPILLVKDFNSKGELSTDITFMTNADSAWLSCAGAIDNPINPFTKNPVDDSGKKNGVFGIDPDGWAPDKQKKNTYRVERWYKIENSIFNAENITTVTEAEALEAGR